MRILSLGWGVQSFALAALSALGELPPLDAAIHADTTHERSETYEFAQRWTPWLEGNGVPVVTVADTSSVIISHANCLAIYLPAYTCYAVDVYEPDGHYVDDEFVRNNSRTITHRAGDPSGMLHRQCTRRWKVLPIRRWLQANRHGQPVEQWIGITVDEIERAKPSDVKYITNRWPLLELGMRRGDVLRWLRDHELEIPVKSSCVCCPYHDRATWREIQHSGNGDWQRAVAIDEIIRNRRPGYVCYLTAARRPLVDCDFSNAEDHGQLALWGEECTGYCFL